MRVILQDISCDKYLGFAKCKLYQLEKTRSDLRLPSLSRRYYVGLFIVDITTDEFDRTIRITCTGDFQIIFHNGTEEWLFNYETNKLFKVSDSVVSGEYSQLWPGAVVDENGQISTISKGKAKTTSFVSKPLSAGAVPTLDAGLAIVGGKVLAGIDAEILTSFPPSGLLVENISERNGLANIEVSRSDLWNGINTVEGISFNPRSPQGAACPYHWTPRIWHSDPGNLWDGIPAEYTTGLYYGAEAYGPADETIKVVYGGQLDDRTGDDGVCEIVTQIDNQSLNHAFFYINDSWTANRDTLSDVLEVVGGEEYRKAYNWFPEGISAAVFDIEYEFANQPDVHFWSYDNSITVRCGVVSSDGKNYTLHRFAGGLQLFASGADYICHSVSSDGKLVVVFTGAETIETATVYDLTNSKETSVSVAGKGFVEGEFIPVAQHEQALPDFDEPIVLDDLGTPGLRSFMGGINYAFPLTYAGSLSGWKITVDKEGATFVGTGQLVHDDCFESVVTVIRPVDGGNLNRTHSVTIDGEAYTAGSFGGLIEVIPYGWYLADGNHGWSEIGIGNWQGNQFAQCHSCVAGDNTVVDELEFTPGAIAHFVDDHLEPPDNFTGQVAWENTTTGPVEGWEYPDTTKVDCSGNVTVSAIDACGHSQELEVAGEIAELNLSGVDEPEVNDTYTASGGTEPYEFSFDGVAANVGGSVATITGVIDCGGSQNGGAVGRVTVTDACGQTAYIDVRLPGGYWSQGTRIDSGYTTSYGMNDCFEESTKLIYGTLVVGGSRVDERISYFRESYGGCPPWNTYYSAPGLLGAPTTKYGGDTTNTLHLCGFPAVGVPFPNPGQTENYTKVFSDGCVGFSDALPRVINRTPYTWVC